MQKKADALHSALSTALSSEEKPINLSTQLQANLQKVLTAGTRKISVRFRITTNAKSQKSMVMRLCPSGILHRSVLPFGIFIVFLLKHLEIPSSGMN